MTRICLSVLVSLGLCFGHTAAVEIKGHIKKLDVEQGTLVLIEGPPKAPVENTYSLARPDIPVTLPGGKAGKLADLKEGTRVGLQVLGGDVTAISVIPTTVVATFVRRDEATKLLSVRLAGAMTDTVFPWQEGVALVVNGKPAGWVDLKAGQKVQLILAADKSAVVHVSAGPDVEAAKESKAKLVRRTGILLDHDPANFKANVITVGVSHVDKKEYHVARDAEIRLFHSKQVVRVLPLKELAPLLKIHYFADLDTRTIVSMDVELPVMKRKVLAVDPEKGILTIEEDMMRVPMKLAPKVEVFLQGKRDDLNQVRPPVWASLGLSLDRAQVDTIFLTKSDLIKAAK